jgi:hypothetical protein
VEMCVGIQKVMVNGVWSFENRSTVTHGPGKFISRT